MGACKKIWLSLVFVFLFSEGFSQNDSIFDSRHLSSLQLYSAGSRKLYHLPALNTGKPFSLFVFLSPECPLSKDYLPLLNELYKKYAEHISFYGVIPGKAYSAAVVNRFARDYRVQYPLLIDSSKALTGYLLASVTPEVILLDNESNLVYKGAVNDLMMALGKRRVQVSTHFLEDAITASIAGKPVSIKRTKAVGCKVNDY